jgi:hypothetical protein
VADGNYLSSNEHRKDFTLPISYRDTNIPAAK